jgi:hypothetical protein
MMKEEWLANHSEQHPSLPACLQPLTSKHERQRETDDFACLNDFDADFVH